MDQTNIPIELIRRYFSDQPVIRAYLFGSFVRGEAHPESDVDLLVELDYDAMSSGLQFLTMQINLQQLLQRKVDLVSAEGLSKHIQPFIDREKKLIYAK